MTRNIFTVAGVLSFLLVPLISPSTSTAQNTLDLNSNPSGVSVTRAGESIGTTPLSLETGPGATDLDLTVNDLGWTSSVEANGDMSMTVNLESTREDPPYRVLVLSEPDGARVVVDGEVNGRAPWTGNLSPGMHTVELRKDGLKTWSATLDVRGGVSLTGNLKSVVRSRSGQSDQQRKKSGRVEAETNGENLVEPVEDNVKLVMPLGEDKTSETESWGQQKKSTSERKKTTKSSGTDRVAKKRDDDTEAEGKTEKPKQDKQSKTQAESGKTKGAQPDPERTKESQGGRDTQPEPERTKKEKMQAEKRAMEKRKQRAAELPSTVPLTVESNPTGARLLVNGNEIGSTPFVKQDFAAGTTTIQLRKDGYRDWKETFYLDEPTQLTVKMKPIWSYLTVRPSPDEMTLSIADREFQLDGKRTFKVQPGEYDVRGSLPELGSRTKTVMLNRGETETVDLTIEFNPKAWKYPTTRDVFLRMAKENLGQLVSDFGIEAGQRLEVIPEYEDWAHGLMNDMLTVVMNRNAILVVDDPSSRQADGALDREFKFYIVEMDVKYESAGREDGIEWLKRHFDLKIHARLIRHKTGEVQFTKFFRHTGTDRIPALLKDELSVPYEPPETEPPL